MSYIFLDESGDLGFDFSKKRTSKYFIVTCLFVDKKRPIEKIVRDIHRGLRKKYKMKSGVLHAYKEDPTTCMRVCRRLAQRDVKLMTIYLQKEKVYTRLHNEKHVLYNYVVNILLDRIMTKRLISKMGTIELIASRRETNRFLNKNFQDYLADQLHNNHELSLTVQIKTPSEEKALQAVDIASWAIFRKYEYADESYYDLLEPIIVEENVLYK